MSNPVSPNTYYGQSPLLPFIDELNTNGVSLPAGASTSEAINRPVVFSGRSLAMAPCVAPVVLSNQEKLSDPDLFLNQSSQSVFDNDHWAQPFSNSSEGIDRGGGDCLFESYGDSGLLSVSPNDHFNLRGVYGVDIPDSSSSTKSSDSIPEAQCLNELPPARVKKRKLYEFLIESVDDKSNQSISWVNRTKGLFRYMNTREIAKQWGEEKGKPNMSYSNLSRAVRNYAKENLINHLSENNLRLPSKTYRINVLHEKVRQYFQ